MARQASWRYWRNVWRFANPEKRSNGFVVRLRNYDRIAGLGTPSSWTCTVESGPMGSVYHASFVKMSKPLFAMMIRAYVDGASGGQIVSVSVGDLVPVRDNSV